MFEVHDTFPAPESEHSPLLTAATLHETITVLGRHGARILVVPEALTVLYTPGSPS